MSNTLNSVLEQHLKEVTVGSGQSPYKEDLGLRCHYYCFWISAVHEKPKENCCRPVFWINDKYCKIKRRFNSLNKIINRITWGLSHSLYKKLIRNINILLDLVCKLFGWRALGNYYSILRSVLLLFFLYFGAV